MFKRIANLFKGFLSLFISGLEMQHPEALLEAEKENLREQISKFNQGLASHAGLCERLMSQVHAQENEERDLRAKAGANLKAGNREVAGQYALRLQTVQRELVENRAQLEQAEKTYQDLIKARDVSVKSAQAKIENLKAGLNDLKVKRALAELSEMASGMVGSIGGAGDTLNRLEEMVREERDRAAGRARVARDTMDMSEIQMKDTEQKALADQALASFAAQEGIVLEGATPQVAPAANEGPSKTMGPATESTPQ